jgi:hypothetical protein
MTVAKNLTTESNLELKSTAATLLEDTRSFPDDAELVLTAAITLCSLIARQVE